jgi:predicted NAD-dependent protein-ADP-ribosyltransferase YbiA (DUF1768 family)
MDCRIGKELNPKTCVYVKECEPGYTRNERFLCRKNTQKKKPNSPKSSKSSKSPKSPKGPNMPRLNFTNVARNSPPLRRRNSVMMPKLNVTNVARNSPLLRRRNSLMMPKLNVTNVARNSPLLRRRNSSSKKLNQLNSNSPNLSAKMNYDTDTVFVFYSKSASAKPGKGKNETIPEDKTEMYTELAAIPEWRKKLSNFWIQPFTLDNMTWASVEHYYQGSKFRNLNPEFYKQFSLDSGSELSKSAVLAKATGGKDVKHKYRDKEIKVDPDFFEGRAEREMSMSQLAKFTQNPDLGEMLKATKRAKLAHYTRGGKLEIFHSLMNIRADYL